MTMVDQCQCERPPLRATLTTQSPIGLALFFFLIGQFAPPSAAGMALPCILAQRHWRQNGGRCEPYRAMPTSKFDVVGSAFGALWLFKELSAGAGRKTLGNRLTEYLCSSIGILFSHHQTHVADHV